MLELQRSAGNAAVGRLLLRQPAADATTTGSRRSIVIVPEKQFGKRIRFGVKVVARLQQPSDDPGILDKIAGSTAIQNDIRKKSSQLETELSAGGGDLFKLTPRGLQDWARRHGVTATWEVEPVEVSLAGDSGKTGGPTSGSTLIKPGLDLLKVTGKLQWRAAQALIEMEVGGSLSAAFLLSKAEGALYREFLRHETQLQRDALDLGKELDALEKAQKEHEAAEKLVDDARERRDKALEEYRKAARNGKLTKKEYEATKKAVQEAADEVEDLAGQAAEKRSAVGRAQHAVTRRARRMQKVAQSMASVAQRGKSWLFKKVVGPRLMTAAKLLARAIPFLNAISLAADLYELGKFLWNLNLGGGGGSGGKGPRGKVDAGGNGSGSGGKGGGGSPPPPAPASSGQPAQKGPMTPSLGGTEKTGQAQKGKGQGTGTAGTPPGGRPGPVGAPPGQGTDPAGTHDGPDGKGKGTPGGTGQGTVGGGKPGGPGGGDPARPPGTVPGKPPGDPARKGKPPVPPDHQGTGDPGDIAGGVPGKGRGKGDGTATAPGKGKGVGGGAGKGDKGGSGGAQQGDDERIGATAQPKPGTVYYPDAKEPPGQNIRTFGFRVVSAVDDSGRAFDPTKPLAAGARYRLSITFERGKKHYKATFTAIARSQTTTGNVVKTVMLNEHRWRIAGTDFEMPAGDPVDLASTIYKKKK